MQTPAIMLTMDQLLVVLCYPDNGSGNKNSQGSIEIMSAWKELCTEVATCNPLDNPEEYYWRYVLIYNAAVVKSQGTQPENCRVVRMVLVGLHTIFKTFGSLSGSGLPLNM